MKVSGIKAPWILFATAAQFLTVLPMDPKVAVDGELLASSMPFFPMVGLLVGLIELGAFVGLAYILPPAVIAAVLVIIPVVLTGGIHLDGLADTGDGIFSGRSRERMLEIMRDSRVGTFGVISIAYYLILRSALIYSILCTLDQASMPALFESGLLIFILPQVAARVSPVVAALTCTYARVGEGLGKPYTEHVVPGYAAAAGILAILTAVGLGLWTGRADLALWIPLGTWIAAFLGNLYIVRKLGGVTGDTFGALICLGELGGLLAAVIIGAF